MPFIRLGDEDRERLKCDEWLEVTHALPTSDAEALEDAGGNYLDFFKRDTARGFRTWVWLALHRSGVKVGFTDLQFDLRAVLLAEEQPGKAPPSDEGDSPIPPTSASSTRRSTRTRSKTSK